MEFFISSKINISDSGNASESPTELETITNPHLNESLRLQYGDDDLERKTSIGHPPPGLTLSQWEEMIRSIYLEQTSEAAKNPSNNDKKKVHEGLYTENSMITGRDQGPLAGM